MRVRRAIIWTLLALMGATVPGNATVRSGLGGFYWSLDTPQGNDLHGVVAAAPGSNGKGLVAVGDASTFLIRRTPITDVTSGWLAGRGRPVSVDTVYRSVARGAIYGLIAVAAGDGSVLIGDGDALDSHAVSSSPLNAVAWFEEAKPILAVAGDAGVAYTYSSVTGVFTAATVDSAIPTPDFQRIFAVPGSNIGFAAARISTPNGTFGVLLKTLDGGQTWNWLANAPMLDDYSDVSFISSLRGFALGVSGGSGVIYQTDDGGQSWEIYGYLNVPMRSLTALDVEHLVLVGNSGIKISLGRGKFQSIPEPVTGLSAPIPLDDVDGSGPDVWAVGKGGVIFHSLNYGQSWLPVTSGGALDASQLKPWNAIQYLSDTDVLVAGDDGTIRRSNDGGRTFTTRPTSVSAALFALAAPGQRNAGQGVTDGEPGVAAGAGRTILTYSPSLGGWQTRGSIPNVDYFGVAMLPIAGGNRAWVVGANGTIVANNGADALWQQQSSDTSKTLRAVDAVEGKYAPCVFAVGDNGAIVRSVDGNTWQAIAPFATGGFSTNLRGVYFRDADTGFVVGDGGAILRTLDGGETWSWAQAPTQANLYAVSALPASGSDTVYAVGEHQTVLKSTDNGASWVLIPQPLPGAGGPGTDFTWRAVHAISSTHVYLAGDQSHRLRSVDGGDTWTETDGQSGVSYTALALAAPNNGVSVGNAAGAPTIAFTDTGFAGTQPGGSPNGAALYAADAVDDDVILAGANGTILRMRQANFGTGGPFGDVSADLRAAASPSPGVFVAAGGNQVIYSTDGGQGWHSGDVNNPYGPGVRFRALGFAPPDTNGNSTGYLAGLIPGQSTPVLFTTADSGKSWNPVTLDFGVNNAGITALSVSAGLTLAAATNGYIYVGSGGQWSAQCPLPNFFGPWLALSADDARWYAVGANGRAARYPDGQGNLEWQSLNTGTTKDITAISGPPPSTPGAGMMTLDGPGGSGQSLRDDVRGVCMRPEGVLLSDSGGLALFGDLDQNTFINALDGISSLMSISGGSIPDDDGYFFGDIFPPVPGPDILPGDGILDIRDATRVVRKTQGLD